MIIINIIDTNIHTNIYIIKKQNLIILKLIRISDRNSLNVIIKSHEQ